MHLRKLEEKDAVFMLEWMHDKEINRFFRFDANVMTLEKVLDFIKESQVQDCNYHFAVTDDEDVYLGTVSLKDVDVISKHAEFAISMRKCAQGTEAASYATCQILEFAFKTLNLERVFLNVLTDNKRAIRFYEKNGFKCEGEWYKHLFIRREWKNLKWYRMMKEDFYAKTTTNV